MYLRPLPKIFGTPSTRESMQDKLRARAVHPWTKWRHRNRSASHDLFFDVCSEIVETPKREGIISTRVYYFFNQYRNQYLCNVLSLSQWRYHSSGDYSRDDEHSADKVQKDEPKQVILINERGNLVANTSALLCVCKQIFRELWGYIFNFIKPDRVSNELGAMYKTKLLNFDFNPFFRFCRMLERLGGVVITGAQIEIVTVNPAYRVREDEDEDEEHDGNDDDVKRWDHLFELFSTRWFAGFPLWEKFIKIEGICY